MCSMNILAGLCQVVAQYPADLNSHQPLENEDVNSIAAQYDQAEPRGLRYIELPRCKWAEERF